MVMSLTDAPWRNATIALVGNAVSLRGTQHGPLIDSHECVVRINQGAFVPLAAESTGVRTDVIMITLTGFWWDKAWMYGRSRRVARTVVGMSPRKRKVWGVDLGRFIPVYPRQWHEELLSRLGSRPSTGAMAVDLLTRTVADREQISLFGFDFWRTPTTYTGTALPAQHDPEAEERFVTSVLSSGRIYR